MDVKNFVDALNISFFTGVPDSKLRPLCDFLLETYGTEPRHHVIAANEGNCAAIAAGYHLATGKIAAIYMQNSGIGNMINPAVSLLSERVYGIPALFVIGWRGEPGLKDEPQHVYQGELTLPLLETLGIATFILEESTSMAELRQAMESFQTLFATGKSAAIIVRAKALTHSKKREYKNPHSLLREEALKSILEVATQDLFVATTGKTGRELFELREAAGQSHDHDFLTVGSMGHASSIALGLALHRPNKRVWCLDGDGAMLMHGGALATIAATKPDNLVHVVINNGAHESVGGMPTAAARFKLADMAKVAGYRHTYCASTKDELGETLHAIRLKRELAFLEIFCAIGSRKDLGRPTINPQMSKKLFMNSLNQIENATTYSSPLKNIGKFCN